MILRYKNLLNIFSLIICSVAVAGCATVTGHDSTIQMAQVDCSGAKNTIDVCYKKAAKICPDGYTIVNNSAPIPPSEINSITGILMTSEIEKYKRGITFTCKGSMDKAQLYF